MRGVFADIDLLDLFAQHLVREFSIESLLFLIEATRFKQQCIDRGLFQPTQDISETYKFARSVHRPSSDILDATSFFENMCHIYDRYIPHSAEYAVNISGKARCDIKKAFAPYSKRFASKRPFASQAGDLAIHMAFSETEMHNVAALFVKLLSVAMDQVAHMLDLDSLLRFRDTDEFNDISCRKQGGEQQPKARRFDKWKIKILPRSPKMNTLKSSSSLEKPQMEELHPNSSDTRVCIDVLVKVPDAKELKNITNMDLSETHCRTTMTQTPRSAVLSALRGHTAMPSTLLTKCFSESRDQVEVEGDEARRVPIR